MLRSATTLVKGQLALRSSRRQTCKVASCVFSTLRSRSSPHRAQSTTNFDTTTTKPRVRQFGLPERNPIKDVAEFKALAATSDVSFEDVCTFLQSSKETIQKLPKAERRAAASKFGAGHVLLWLWDHPELYPQYSKEFTVALCWFLHAEGLDEYVWGWVEVAARSHKITRGPITAVTRNGKPAWGPPMFWAHHLLGSLVQAHVLWARDETANSGLRQYTRAFDTFFSGELSHTVSLVAAWVTMKRALENESCKPCEPALFDAFLAQTDCLLKGHPLKYAKAKLPLYHPSKAHPIPMLEFARKEFEHSSSKLAFITKPSAQNQIGHSFLRAHFMLQLQGRSADAHWLENVVEQHYPRFWAARDAVHKSSLHDPKLQTLVRTSAIKPALPGLARRQGDGFSIG